MANLDKMVYEVREQLGALSDDRFIDRRYIVNAINIFRADLYRKLLSRKPYYSTVGIEQSVPISVTLVDKSLFPGLNLECSISRSKDSIPTLLHESVDNNWFRVRTIDVAKNTIEVIEPSRVTYLTFEFNTAYAFLDTGKVGVLEDESLSEGYFIYVVAKDRFEITNLMLTGIFEDPMEVNPDLKEYPIKAADWVTIFPNVIEYVKKKVADDPLNNSEADEGGRGLQQRRSNRQSQREA